LRESSWGRTAGRESPGECPWQRASESRSVRAGHDGEDLAGCVDDVARADLRPASGLDRIVDLHGLSRQHVLRLGAGAGDPVELEQLTQRDRLVADLDRGNVLLTHQKSSPPKSKPPPMSPPKSPPPKSPPPMSPPPMSPPMSPPSMPPSQPPPKPPNIMAPMRTPGSRPEPAYELKY